MEAITTTHEFKVNKKTVKVRIYRNNGSWISTVVEGETGLITHHDTEATTVEDYIDVMEIAHKTAFKKFSQK